MQACNIFHRFTHYSDVLSRFIFANGSTTGIQDSYFDVFNDIYGHCTQDMLCNTQALLDELEYECTVMLFGLLWAIRSPLNRNLFLLIHNINLLLRIHRKPKLFRNLKSIRRRWLLHVDDGIRSILPRADILILINTRHHIQHHVLSAVISPRLLYS